MADQMPLDIVYRVRCTVYRFWYTVSGKRFTTTREFLLLQMGFLDAVFSELLEPQEDRFTDALAPPPFGDGHEGDGRRVSSAALAGLPDALTYLRKAFSEHGGYCNTGEKAASTRAATTYWRTLARRRLGWSFATARWSGRPTPCSRRPSRLSVGLCPIDS